MELVITLRKKVENTAEAIILTTWVVDKLKAKPEILISSQTDENLYPPLT